MKKKIICFLLSVCMVLSITPLMTYAESNTNEISCTSTESEDPNYTNLTFHNMPADYAFIVYSSRIHDRDKKPFTSFSDFIRYELKNAEDYNDPAQAVMRWYGGWDVENDTPVEYVLTNICSRDVEIWVGPKNTTDFSEYTKVLSGVKVSKFNVDPGDTIDDLLDYVDANHISFFENEPLPTSFDSVYGAKYTGEITWYEQTGDTLSDTPVTEFKFGKVYGAKMKVVFTENNVAFPSDADLDYFSDDISFKNDTFTIKEKIAPYRTDANKKMATSYVQSENGYGSQDITLTNLDIRGFFNNQWISSTYEDDGFESLISVDGNQTFFDATSELSPIGGTGLEASINTTLLNHGKVAQVVYKVKNTASTDITYSLASGGDIYIGEDDYATIEPFANGSGFMMKSTEEEDKNSDGEYPQLNLWLKDTNGVTDVDGFWYGNFEDRFDQYFHDLADKETLEGTDSGTCWHWKDRTISAGDTQTYTVLIGIGGQDSENDVNFVPGDVKDTTPTDNIGGAVMKNTVDELKSSIPMTDEERENLAHGQDMDVFLVVKDITDSVDASDKATVEKLLKDAQKSGMYLDISLYKKLGLAEAVKVPNTNGKIKVTFTVPEKLRNSDSKTTRTYQIICVHNGVASVIDATYDPTNYTLTFETDAFSTYALTYTDETKKSDDSGTASDTTAPDKVAPEKINPAIKSPSTGESRNVPALISALFIAAACVAAVGVFKKSKKSAVK